MTNLSKKIGNMDFDGFITDITPKTEVRGKTIRKLDKESVLVKGTVLAISSGTAGDGKLVVLGETAKSNETLTPDCILCDDVLVGTENDVNVPVYTAGCFNPDKIVVKSEYELTANDYDTLRKYGIVFKAISK